MLGTIGEPMHNPFWIELPMFVVGLLGSYLVQRRLRARLLADSDSRAFFAGGLTALPAAIVGAILLNACVENRVFHGYDMLRSSFVFTASLTGLSTAAGFAAVGLRRLFGRQDRG